MSFLFNESGAELMIMLCIRLLIVFAILPIHEFAHGFSAKKLGDKTALIAGRLTLNPLAHVDPIGAILLILFGFGWAKPVPINPRNFQNYRRDTAITAAAGPLSNLLCALAAIFAGRVYANILMLTEVTLTGYLISIAISYFAMINLSLAVFNLIPIEPLDGSRILSYILPPKANAFLYKHGQIIHFAFLILIFGGLLSGPLSWLIGKLYNLFSLLFVWVDWLFALI